MHRRRDAALTQQSCVRQSPCGKVGRWQVSQTQVLALNPEAPTRGARGARYIGPGGPWPGVGGITHGCSWWRLGLAGRAAAGDRTGRLRRRPTPLC